MDALSELGIKTLHTPLTPMNVWQAIREAKAAAGQYNPRHSGAMPTGPRKARPDARLRIEPGISRFRVRAHARPGMTGKYFTALIGIVLIRCAKFQPERFDAQVMDRAGGAGDVEPDQLRLQRDPDQ
jgi:hypothetical protein